MRFGPLELQACGENNFTMKALGVLAFRPHLRTRLIEALFHEEVVDDSTILFFTRIGEGFFREAIEREQSDSTFETRLNAATKLPREFRWRRNTNGKLTQPAKWHDEHIHAMLQSNGLSDDREAFNKLSFLQDTLNTEPDVVLQWGSNLALIEIKVLSNEGTQQLDRQRQLGEFLAEMLGWRSFFAFIGPEHGSRPSWGGCSFMSWRTVADLFHDTPEVSEYIREFAFFYRGQWQSMVASSVAQPAPTAFDHFLKQREQRVERGSGSVMQSPSAAIDTRPSSADSATRDQWHFSHLGRAYFDRVVSTSRASGHWPISRIWTGVTGVPYAQREQGRAINANWMIETVDGRRRTNQKAIRFNEGRMRSWRYDEIAEHFGFNR